MQLELHAPQESSMLQQLSDISLPWQWQLIDVLLISRASHLMVRCHPVIPFWDILIGSRYLQQVCMEWIIDAIAMCAGQCLS